MGSFQKESETALAVIRVRVPDPQIAQGVHWLWARDTRSHPSLRRAALEFDQLPEDRQQTIAAMVKNAQPGNEVQIRYFTDPAYRASVQEAFGTVRDQLPGYGVTS